MYIFFELNQTIWWQHVSQCPSQTDRRMDERTDRQTFHGNTALCVPSRSKKLAKVKAGKPGLGITKRQSTWRINWGASSGWLWGNLDWQTRVIKRCRNVRQFTRALAKTLKCSQNHVPRRVTATMLLAPDNIHKSGLTPWTGKRAHICRETSARRLRSSSGQATYRRHKCDLAVHRWTVYTVY